MASSMVRRILPWLSNMWEPGEAVEDCMECPIAYAPSTGKQTARLYFGCEWVCIFTARVVDGRWE